MSHSLPDAMHWQLYQAYLRGPHSLFDVFEQALGRQALCGTEEPEQQQRTINSLSEQIARLQAQIERLQAGIRDFHHHNFRLGRRDAEIEAVVSKDLHNSSRPPSTDAVWAKRTKNLRRPSVKRPGAQIGHHGSTLRLSSHPDRIIEHRPSQCISCHASLATVQTLSHHRQQVCEVVPAKLKVTEHRLAVLRGPACGKRPRGEFAHSVRSGVQYGAGVKALVLYLQQYQLLPYQRTAEAMRELFGCHLWAGTVSNIIRECAAGLVETELKIKRGLRRSSVMHADETGLRINQRLGYVHVTSTAHLTHYAAANHRGHTAMDEINVLPRYRGTIVHDGLLSYKHYAKCRHALCGVHLLRELRYFEEVSEERKVWAAPLKQLLREMKAEVERSREAGGNSLAEDQLERLTASYERLVAQRQQAQPPPHVPEQVIKQARKRQKPTYL